VRVWLVILGCVALALALYFAAQKLVLLALAVAPEARAGFVPLRELPHRAREVLRVLPRLLYREPHLSTPLLGALQVGLLALALLGAALRSAAERSARPIAWTAALAFAALLSVVGVAALVHIFWPVPRVLTAAGFFWGGLVALSCVQSSGVLRRAALLAGALLWLGSAGIDHHAAADQLRANTRDLLRMGRLAGRLETLPGASGLKRIAVVGAAGTYPDLATATWDLNLSAFGTTWSWAGLLAEAGGPSLTLSTDDDRARAAAYCARAGKWPAPDALAVEGELAIACF
jgi:hypothetical protein